MKIWETVIFSPFHTVFHSSFPFSISISNFHFIIIYCLFHQNQNWSNDNNDFSSLHELDIIEFEQIYCLPFFGYPFAQCEKCTNKLKLWFHNFMYSFDLILVGESYLHKLNDFVQQTNVFYTTVQKLFLAFCS